MTFWVEAIWDEQAQVFVSKSNIRGLVIETETIAEFKEVMEDVVGELIFANHMQGQELMKKRIVDLVPTVIFERSPEVAVAG